MRRDIPGADAGQYEYVCEIARGGMAEVSLVLRREGGFLRMYALKRLLPAYEGDPDVRSMFADEARIAGLLRHPNVVSVLDVGEDENGVYLIMDYVEGLPLTALSRRAAQTSDPVPVQVALRIAIQAAEGLHAAHELTAWDGSPLHLVHRDVSPQNVLVGFDGIVRVTDFGVAKALGRRSRTTTGVIKGKAGYMAPEMLRFEEPDRRADLFSLGVVLYELLAGRRLYRSTDLAAAARRILNEPAPDIALERPDVPDDLSELSFRLLAKDPELRPATARDVARRLQNTLDSLVSEEGEILLDDYMTRSLDASEIEYRRSLIDDVERGVTKTRPALSAPREEPTMPRAGRRPRMRVVAFAAMLLLAGTALGIGLGAAVGDDPAAVERARAAPPIADRSSGTLVPEPEAPAAQVATAAEDASAAVPAAASEAPTAEVRTDPEPRRPRRRVRRPRRSSPMEAPTREATPALPVIETY